ncbi:heat shock 70 kDa protein 5 [Cryptomeria japonica]|uniref:heat shock 70 kDa protein 5 n=1 Tax=Cryptomeria japonica TaxID=3369 RepID=UPI0025ACE242|nr:heat shock 70 kDa protein 5 [Cryptomeria japonica]
MARDKAIGIDLGTTYSCVGVWHCERVEIITNDQGNRTTPSIVAFNETERLVGEGAKNQIVSNLQNTVYDVKRMMGRGFSDPVLQSDISHWPFSVVEGSNGRFEIRITYRGESKTFAPEEISAMVLFKMKEIAKTFLKSEVMNAVITVPAYFNDSQRQATMDAAHLAGINVLQLLNEPNAAAIAYGLDTKTYSSTTGKNILVFDVGGGTFDVSVITIRRGSFDVRAVGGDTHLGGEDFDTRLLNHFVGEFERKNKKRIGGNPKALRRLRTACEKAKRSLSAATETTVEIECLCGSTDFYSKISRAKFEDLNSDLFHKCIAGVRLCLADAHMVANEIDEVVLVGGSTRIPKLQKMIEGLFGQEKLCRSINQDEAVAYGASVQAAVLTGQCSDVVLQDVTPLSLGIAVTRDDIMSVIIPRNTHIPVKKVQTFRTAEDYQTVAAISVYEGERTSIMDNNLLGKFDLPGIPADLRGKESLDVCFELDANGILKVLAKNRVAVEKSIIIRKDTCGLSKEEIARMKFDAERYSIEDQRVALKHKARHALEDSAYDRRNRAREESLRGTIMAAEANKIENVTKSTLDWIEQNDDADIEEFKKKLEEVEQLFNALSTSTSK